MSSGLRVPDDLFGRETELARLAGIVDGTAQGRRVWLLTGEAGIGKTRLLEAASDHATRSGARVLSASGAEFEAEIGYSGLNQLLLPVVDHLSGLARPLQDALKVALGLGDGAPPRALTVGNATLALLGQVAQATPVLLVIDDLGWIDRASAAVLGMVARRLDESQIAMIAATRSTEAEPFMRDGFTTIPVEPLPPIDAERLVLESYPGLARVLTERLLDEASGNPLALHAFGAAASRRLADNTLRTVSTFPVTRPLPDLIGARVDELPGDTQRLLLRLALEGRGALRVLVRDDASREILVVAERAGVVTIAPGGASIRFSHPLYRSAIVSRASDEERREAHRQIAELLDDDPDRRAWHLSEAIIAPDEDVARQLDDAAHRALARGDANTAVDALVRASTLSPDKHDESRRLAEAAYLGTDITGERAHALRLLADARRADPDGVASLHGAAATVFMLLDDNEDVHAAFRILHDALSDHRQPWSVDDAELTDALTALMYVCWWSGREKYWSAFTRMLTRFDGEAPELLFVLARTFRDPARASGADRKQLSELIDRLRGDMTPNLTIRLSSASAYLDLFGELRASAWRIVDDGRHGGMARSLIGAYMHLCIDDFMIGRWDEQEELADKGLALCRRHGYWFVAWYFMYHKALLAAVRGDPEEALGWADGLTKSAIERDALGAAQFAHLPRALACAASGDWEAAYQHASAVSPAGQFAPLAANALWVAYEMVEAAVRTGRIEQARQHVNTMVEIGVPALSPRLELVTWGARALVAEDTESIGLYEHAIALPDAHRWPFDLARIRLAFGERLRRTQEPARARDQLHEARDVFERLEARAWTDRTLQELRAARDPELRGPSDSALTALTAQERAIVELAAGGLSNKEIGTRLFLSPRTVAGHLYRVFPKLGISSRAALRDALAGQGSSTPAAGEEDTERVI